MGFSLLTIFSTQDYQLILNKATSPLPVIQTPIPLAWFYWVIPIILFLLYWYFHLHQLHIWKLISRLPAYFPDGTPLDQKIFPWMVITWSKNFFTLLQETNSQKSQYRLVVFLIWVSVPITLFSFWIRYLPRHDFWSVLHIILLVWSIFLARHFYFLATQILKRDSNHILNWRGRRLIDSLFFEIPILAYTCLFTWVAIWGNPNKWSDDIKPFLTANLINQELSEKPPNWDSDLENIDRDQEVMKIRNEKKKHKRQLNRVKGAELEEADLRYARATGAFLPKANLSYAQLEGANLRGAHLEKANLYATNLRGADLFDAHLEGANLLEAQLTGANLVTAHLEEAILIGAQLAGANLEYANLAEADLYFSLLFNAENIKMEQVMSAKRWDQALYDPSFIKTWLEEDRNAYRKKLPEWLPIAAEFHYIYEQEKYQLEKLNEWYCLYNSPECKKPEAEKAEKPKAAPAK